ncbi:hypothetical protein AN958_00618 [Leucoagaricus sp. SymC.cos]|nr:hypothetical protein AN958_00618 [Leucoagaricus sp. SymC.cos]
MAYISIAAFRAVGIVCQSTAMVLATFRLYRRYKTRNVWWDDFCAFTAFILDIVHASTIIFRQEDSPKLTPKQRERKVAIFWMTGLIPPLIVWLSRISICLSIARIDVQYTAVRIRPWTYVLIAAFALVAAILFSQKLYVCLRSTAWQLEPAVYCNIGVPLGYTSITGDLLADSILTAISFRLLWKVRIRQSQKRLLSWIFAANIWSSLVGIVYGVVVILGAKLGEGRSLVIGTVVHLKVA